MEPPSEIYSFLLLNFFHGFSLGAGIVSLLIVLLLFFSAAISASEIAFFSLSPKDLKETEKTKTRIGKIILELIKNPKELLAAILIANNFVNISIVILSSYLTSQLYDFGENYLFAFLLQVIAVTFLILFFGEMLPKVYATKNAFKLASLLAFPMFVLKKIFKPMSSILIMSSSFIDKRIKKAQYTGNVRDLSHALELTTQEKKTNGQEHKILKGIVKFGNTDVKQIMKPRTDVDAFEYNTDFKTLLAEILESGHSRIPIYKNSFDNIAGILYIKDLLPHFDKDETFKWQNLIRPPFFVPETKKIDDLLKEFQEKKNHLAIVVDEYGGTSGIVTLEDIMEEIVGDITDEFDEENLMYSKLDKNNFVFEGKIPLIDLYRVLGIEGTSFEKEKGDSDTLAGFIIGLAGKIPQKDEKIKFKNFLFTIESSDKRKINRVKITILEIEEREENAEVSDYLI